MTVIDINLYYGGELCNDDENEGLPFKGRGIKCYYIQIHRRLKALNDLKRLIMEELHVNPVLHDIKITFRSPHEILHQHINYRYMVIEKDKHVKIMFDRMEKMAQINAIELYISAESRAEVGGEEMQQTTTNLQFILPDDRSTTLGGYTPPCEETPTPIEKEGGHRHRDKFCKPRDESFTHLEEEDEEVVNQSAINGEDLDGRDEYEETIERDDFDEDVDDHEIAANLNADDIFDCDENDADDDIGVQHVTNTIPAYTPPAPSFYANTWKNMVDPSNVEIPSASTWQEGMNFGKGLIFANKEAVKRALTIYTAKENKQFLISRSTKVKLCAKCVDKSCKWYVGAFMKPKLHGLWVVTVYVGPHTCISLGLPKDGRMMDSNFVASELLPILLKKHTTTVHDLRTNMSMKFGHELSYSKVWDAKQKAIAKIFGDWEKSYQKLQKLLLAYIDQDPGTRFFYHTTPGSVTGTSLLHYVFWAFAPCIDGFKYCKPVINIDGTHLYGKYKGKLLIAIATDANNKVFPLAFAVVDIESGSSWGWFLECLRETIRDVIPNEGICIISDQHEGIKNAIAAWPRDENGRLRVFHRYCLRHVTSNFNTHFQDPILKSLALKAGYAIQEAEFNNIMDSIKNAEIEAIKKELTIGVNEGDPKPYKPHTYLMSEPVDMWTQSHDGGKRYGAMTTNISECFNGVLEGARGLPIAAMVEFTWSKLVAYFHDRHKDITQDLLEGKRWSKYAMSIYDTNKLKATQHHVREFNNQDDIHQVFISYSDHSTGGGHSYEIRLMDRTCGCGEWQNIKIPCSHVIKICELLHIDPTKYIDPCYSLANAIKSYSHGFTVPKSESLWRDADGLMWVPNPGLLRDKGRPVKSRIRNEMDGVKRKLGSRREESDLRENQPKQRCGLCHEEGHNRRKCSNSCGASTSGHLPN